MAEKNTPKIVISKRTTRKIKVKCVEPLDLGEERKYQFTAEFKRIDKAVWSEMMKNGTTIEESLRHGLLNIEHAKDVDGNGLPFSPELVDAFLEEPWIVSGLSRAQLAVQGGVTQSTLHKAELQKN